MKKTTIDISGEIELIYDENSPEFKQAFDDYKACIDKTGDIEDMLKYVAHNIVRFGEAGMVEGVGYVGINGRKPTECYSGIMVEDGFDDFHFDGLSTRESVTNVPPLFDEGTDIDPFS